MNKKLLPIILIGGAALLFFAFRRRPDVTVTADMPIRQTAEEFETDFQASSQTGPTLLDKATDAVNNIFGKDARQKTALQARRTAVKRAAQKGISKKKAKAVTKQLSTFSFPKIGGDEVMF